MDVNSIKNRVNQLIAIQHTKKETLVHLYLFYNVTRFHTGEQATYQPSDGCSRKDTSGCHHAYNIITSLCTSLNYQQIVLHIHSILANLRDSLYYTWDKSPCIQWIHRCSHNWNIITSCTTSGRSQDDANTHWRIATFNHALTSLIRGIQFTSIDT